MSEKKREKQYYQQPGFYLIALTVLLWVAFLFKVFKQNTPPEPPENKPLKLSTKAPEPLKIKSQGNATHKQLEKRQTKPEQAAIEALRKSLEKVKPAKNVIIRGEALTLIQATGRNNKSNVKLIINRENLKSLNADYNHALKNK
jgi:hypothetical protein